MDIFWNREPLVFQIVESGKDVDELFQQLFNTRSVNLSALSEAGRNHQKYLGRLVGLIQ